MAPLSLPLDHLEFTQRDGKRMIRIPWEAADRIHEWLKAAGVGSTVHWEPGDREAFLAPWTDLDADRLRALLAEGQAA
jgi:hypothetical protein